MELQDFVRESLLQIVRGLEGARDGLKESTAIICPANIGTHIQTDRTAHYGYLGRSERVHPRIVETVEFDVAVVVTEGRERKAGLGISVGSIGIGGQGKNESSSSSQSRLKFKVPVVWPESSTADAARA